MASSAIPAILYRVISPPSRPLGQPQPIVEALGPCGDVWPPSSRERNRSHRDRPAPCPSSRALEYSPSTGWSGEAAGGPVRSPGYAGGGLTDHNNLFALLKFYGAARVRSKPIVGCDLALRDENGALSQATVFVESAAGYGRLTRLVSDAYLGLSASAVAVAGCKDGPERGVAPSGRHSPLGALAEEDEVTLLGPWPCRPSGIAFSSHPDWPSWGGSWPRRRDASAGCGVPVVATNDVRFLEADDYEAHETVCIHEGGPGDLAGSGVTARLSISAAPRRCRRALRIFRRR